MENALCVHDTKKGTFGVVTLKDATFWCCTCQKGSCGHARFLGKQDIAKEDMPTDMQEMVCTHLQRKGHTKSAYHHPCATSTKIIHYHRTEELTASLRVHIQKYEDDNGVLHLAPEAGTCPRCGAQLGNKTPVKCSNKASCWLFKHSSMFLTKGTYSRWPYYL